MTLFLPRKSGHQLTIDRSQGHFRAECRPTARMIGSRKHTFILILTLAQNQSCRIKHNL